MTPDIIFVICLIIVVFILFVSEKFIGFMLKTEVLTNKLREDKWWISPLLVLLGLLSFVVYSTWAAWQGEYFCWWGY